MLFNNGFRANSPGVGALEILLKVDVFLGEMWVTDRLDCWKVIAANTELFADERRIGIQFMKGEEKGLDSIDHCKHMIPPRLHLDKKEEYNLITVRL